MTSDIPTSDTPASTTPGAHPFDEAVALRPAGEGLFHGATHEAYWNMAGPFGGITAATLLNAALSDPRRLGEPVTMTINYCAAIQRGDFTIGVREIRSGKSVQHLYVELSQGETVAANATVVTARRNDNFSHQPVAMPQVPPADAVRAADRQRPLAWLQSYDFRFIEGPPDFGTPHPELKSAHTKLWVADAPRRPLDHLSLASICDAFIVRIFQVRGLFVPAATVSMTAYFHATPEEMAAQGTGHVLAIADSSRFDRNFFDQTGAIWSASGALLANTTQVVWFKE